MEGAFVHAVINYLLNIRSTAEGHWGYNVGEDTVLSIRVH